MIKGFDFLYLRLLGIEDILNFFSTNKEIYRNCDKESLWNELFKRDITPKLKNETFNYYLETNKTQGKSNLATLFPENNQNIRTTKYEGKETENIKIRYIIILVKNV